MLCSVDRAAMSCYSGPKGSKLSPSVMEAFLAPLSRSAPVGSGAEGSYKVKGLL